MLGSEKLEVLRLAVEFRRKYLSIFMVTYLPTILMNILNQATNYLSGESKYDLIITVNITSMMVLASIYLSVSTSLPSTPNIKPVEVWLLFNLAYPFMVILINVAVEVIFQNKVNNHYLHLIFCFDIETGWNRRKEQYKEVLQSGGK